MLSNITVWVEMLLNGIFTGAMYALMALGLSLIWSIVGVFNFSHGALYMVGGYVTWVLVVMLGVNLLLAILLTFVIMFPLGFVLDILLIKPLGKYAGTDEWGVGTVVVTLGVAIFFEAVALSIFGGQFRTLPPLLSQILDFGILRVSLQMVTSFSVAISLIIILWQFLKRTKIGLAMQAMSQDNEGAQMVGINPQLVYPLTFAISASLTGAVGSLLAPIYNIYPVVGWNAFGKAFVVVVIGGLGSISGTIFAGFVLGLLESFSNTFVSTHWTTVISFGTMIVILLLKPKGLFGIKEA